MKLKTMISIFWVTVLLAGCNLPGRDRPVPTPTADVVATEVQRMLTELPTNTSQPARPTATRPAETVSPVPPLATETPAPSPTAPATLTATLNPADPASTLGKPVWKDTLDSAKNFYLYENENTRIEQGSGTLKLTSLSAVGWHGWTLTYVQKPANFYLEAVFKTGDCSSSDLYGLIFRASKENAGYFYGVTCDGHYNLYSRDFNNNTNTEIKSLQANATILQGSAQTNRLGVLANGDKLTLFANGVLVDEVQDSTYSAGYFGPFIAGNATAGFSVELDEIGLWKVN